MSEAQIEMARAELTRIRNLCALCDQMQLAARDVSVVVQSQIKDLCDELTLHAFVVQAIAEGRSWV